MKDKLIEQRKLLKVGCYKWHKFKDKDVEQAKCPWGYVEIQPVCQNCIWFSIQKVSADKQVVVFDREIDLVEANRLVIQWEQEARVEKAAPVDPLTMREEIQSPIYENVLGDVK